MGQCPKCGSRLIGTAANPPGDQLCHYCERDQLKADNAKLRKALAELVGTDGKAELEQFEASLRAAPGIERDKIAALNAVHALQDTLASEPCPNCGKTDMQLKITRETKPECLRNFIHCNYCGHERQI